MRNFLVIGNPIKHSISPKIHNYWFKEYKINAAYTKQELHDNELSGLIKKVINKEIEGINITVPFKEKIIPHINELTQEAEDTNSVNTVYLSNNRVIGHNTDIAGFYLSLKDQNIDFKTKKILILGAGGVTPSVIVGLKKLGTENIVVTNRTKENALKKKKKFDFLRILEWGKTIDVDLIINTTSLGLKQTDQIKIDYNFINPECFFYDLIYSPKETNFLKDAKKKGLTTQNGLMMFIYQAAEAFKTWHGINPKIDENLVNFLKND